MSEIYWITRLDVLNGWLISFSVICGIVIFISVVAYLGFRGDYEKYGDDGNKNWMLFFSKIFKVSTPFFVLFVILTIFTPTTKEAMLIYGVGNTINYVKQNNTLQQITDKCINALDAWVDSLTEKESKNEN